MSKKNIICLYSPETISEEANNGLEKILGKKQSRFLSRALFMDSVSTALRVDDSELYIARLPSFAASGLDDFVYLFESEEPVGKIRQKASAINMLPEEYKNTGNCLSYASEFFFKAGADNVLFLGSGAPLLPPVVLRASFELLATNQVVLGPTFNGGHYLIGCNEHYPQIFEHIDWKSPNTYREMAARLTDQGLIWQELELSYEVSGPEELEQLYFDIDNLRLTGENDLGFHTEKCLQNLEK